MLRSVKELQGYALRAKDGDLGKVKTFYFDDESWTIRYLVADTGNWLSGRQVLINPQTLKTPIWDERVFPVNLTCQQVENSPSIDKDKPVSRQHQYALHEYYGWPVYWGVHPYVGASVFPAVVQKEQGEAADGDPNLRSTEEVIDYTIAAEDGDIGHVEDFVVDDEYWRLVYLVVDTRNWLPGKKVLIASAWIDRIDWPEAKVHVDMARERIENSPQYDPSKPINKEYEVRLYDYYGRPYRWEKS